MSARDELAAMVRPISDRMWKGHSWIKTANGPRRIDKVFTEIELSEHVMGGNAYGLCPIAPGSSTTRVAVLDLDSHKGATDWLEMRRTADAIALSLEMDGYKPVLFRSSGGKGIHIYLIFDADQDAYSVRQMLAGVLASCNLKPGTAGVADGEVEAYPKQSEVPIGGFGSMVILPLAGKSEALGVLEWVASPNVPVLKRPPAPERVSTAAPELARIKAALDAIPNSGGEELDYDKWRDIGFSIHHATDGSDEGLALFHELSARASLYDPDFIDTRFWPYVNSERGGPVITERTLMSLAEAHGWMDPSIADDFEIVAEIQQTQTNKSRFTPIPAAQFAQGRPPSWIVKDVLPQAELVVVFGASGSGKSFWVLDLVSAIAQGVPWRGKKTTQGKVIYIAAEGASGFKKRLKAYGMHHGVALEDLDVAVIPDGPNFLEKADIIDLGNALLAFGRTDIVVVDTLAQVMPGDENSGEDMGRVVAHCRTIHKVTGALVILIHHSGKTEGKGARGWSGLRAAADAEIEIVRSENDRAALITKLKDGEDGAELGFTLTTVSVDMDEDGEVISSCVVSHSAEGAKGRRQLAPKGAHEKDVLGIARDLVGLDGSAPDVAVIIDAYIERNPRDPLSTGRDTRRQHCLRAIKTLMDRGALVADGAALRLPNGD